MPNGTKLTKTVVERLALTTSGAALVYDSELPGFGVRVGQKVKAYFVERRVNGRTVRVTIGKHGAGWTADKARERARELRVEMDKGKDPIHEKRAGKLRAKAEQAAASARSVSLEDVFNAYVDTRKLKPLTLADYKRVMREAFEDWKPKPIAELTKDMIQKRHAKIGKRSEARANLAMRVLRALFNFAAAKYEDEKGQPLIGDNPVRRLSQTRGWYFVKRRQTVLRRHQLAPWFDAVTALTDREEPGELRDSHGRFAEGAAAYNAKADTVRDYLLALLLTGLRRQEAATLRWADVDLKARTLTIPDPKNREQHTLPLSDFLAELVERRKAVANAHAVYVFPGEGKGGYIVEPRRQMDKVEESSGVAFNLHDLRRTFATIAESLDIPAYALKRLLNHKNGADVTAGYIVADVERLREPMQKITDYILRLAKQSPSADVVSLPSRGEIAA